MTSPEIILIAYFLDLLIAHARSLGHGVSRLCGGEGNWENTP